MREFGSFLELAAHIAAIQVHLVEELAHGLEKSVELIEKTARSEFGQYQPAVGAFPAWVELADYTKDERLKLGFSENDPLLRTGDLANSLEHAVDFSRLEGGVGSTDERMVYHEFGTVNMPPRPVLGPALFRNRRAIEILVGGALTAGLMGASRHGPAGEVHPSLGYNLETSGP